MGHRPRHSWKWRRPLLVLPVHGPDLGHALLPGRRSGALRVGEAQVRPSSAGVKAPLGFAGGGA